MIALHQFEEGTPPKQFGVLQLQEYRMVAINLMCPTGCFKTNLKVTRNNLKQLHSCPPENTPAYLLSVIPVPFYCAYLILRYGTKAQQDHLKFEVERPKNWEGKTQLIQEGDQVECLVPTMFYDKEVPIGHVFTATQETLDGLNRYRTQYKKL